MSKIYPRSNVVAGMISETYPRRLIAVNVFDKGAAAPASASIDAHSLLLNV
jgi:hypothetical protein